MKHITKCLGYEKREKSSIRWLILVLCCCSTFGDYYCYDNVGATHDHLKDQLNLGKYFEYYYSMLYSIYSFANIILPILGGLFMVFCGLRVAFISFGLIVCIGQLVFTLGSQYNSITTMIIGRGIFSIGGENLNITQTSLICYWFYKSELALPLGLTITISRLGSSINDIISPRIAAQNNATPAYWIGFLFCCLSQLCIFGLCVIDALKKDTETDSNDNENEGKMEEIGIVTRLYTWQEFKGHIAEFKRLYWLITGVCFFTYGAVMPFNFIVVNFLTTTYLKSMSPIDAREQAGLYMAIPFIISAFMVPAFGYMIDKFGKRAYMTLVSGLMTAFGFLLFFFCPPLFPLIFIGLTYSLFAAVIWPSISLITPRDLLGFAYGITTSIQAIGMAVNPIIVASMYVWTKDYNLSLAFFSVLGMISVLLGIWIIKENEKNDGVLDMIEFGDKNEEEDKNKKSLEANQQNDQDEEKQVLLDNNKENDPPLINIENQ